GVQFWRPPERFSIWPDPVVSDEQGRFELRGVNCDQGLALMVTDNRYARQWLTIRPPEKDAELTLSLAPVQTVEGQVVAEDTGKPLPHARLTIYSGDDEFGGGTGMDGKADGQGLFRLSP